MNHAWHGDHRQDTCIHHHPVPVTDDPLATHFVQQSRREGDSHKQIIDTAEQFNILNNAD